MDSSAVDVTFTLSSHLRNMLFSTTADDRDLCPRRVICRVRSWQEFRFYQDKKNEGAGERTILPSSAFVHELFLVE